MSDLDGDAILSLVETRLAERYPSRVVSREARDFAQQRESDRRRGIYTVIARGANGLDPPDLSKHHGRLLFFVLAQIELPEAAGGRAVEQAEWAMWRELEAFFNAPGPGLCPVSAVEMDLSAQTLVPCGWVAVQCKYSELD